MFNFSLFSVILEKFPCFFLHFHCNLGTFSRLINVGHFRVYSWTFSSLILGIQVYSKILSSLIRDFIKINLVEFFAFLINQVYTN